MFWNHSIPSVASSGVNAETEMQIKINNNKNKTNIEQFVKKYPVRLLGSCHSYFSGQRTWTTRWEFETKEGQSSFQGGSFHECRSALRVFSTFQITIN